MAVDMKSFQCHKKFNQQRELYYITHTLNVESYIYIKKYGYEAIRLYHRRIIASLTHTDKCSISML